MIHTHTLPFGLRVFARLWFALSWFSKSRSMRVNSTFLFARNPPAFFHCIRIDRSIPLPIPTQWLGALRPTETYRESQPFNFSAFSNALNYHMMYMAPTLGHSSIFASTIPNTPMRPVRVPADHLAELKPWDIAPDEALDERHPLIACAFLHRARMSEESRGFADEPDRALVDSLSDSIAGRLRRDGLYPDFAQSLDRSSWARAHFPRLLESSMPIAISKRERDELNTASLHAQREVFFQRAVMRL
jgi:hypothetical protein